MAKMTKTALENALRAKTVKTLMELIGENEEVMQVAGNVFAYPTVDEEGNDAWIEITVKVPKGERIPKDEGGGFAGYDGYSMAEFYAQEQNAKVEEAKAKKAKADAKALSKAKKSKTSKPATETEVNEEGGE